MPGCSDHSLKSDGNHEQTDDSAAVSTDTADTDCQDVPTREDCDHDGYPVDSDCDDTDPAVNPGAAEDPFDGTDNDCNPETLDDDGDGDGYPVDSDCDDTADWVWEGTEIRESGAVLYDQEGVAAFCAGFCEVDNTSLPTANAEALVAEIDTIGGEVVISGNAP